MKTITKNRKLLILFTVLIVLNIFVHIFSSVYASEEIIEDQELSEYTYSEHNDIGIQYIDRGTIYLPELKKDGCLFLEWNTSPDGNGTAYKAGDEYPIFDAGSLYAIYVKGGIVILDADGGEILSNSGDKVGSIAYVVNSDRNQKISTPSDADTYDDQENISDAIFRSVENDAPEMIENAYGKLSLPKPQKEGMKFVCWGLVCEDEEEEKIVPQLDAQSLQLATASEAENKEDDIVSIIEKEIIKEPFEEESSTKPSETEKITGSTDSIPIENDLEELSIESMTEESTPSEADDSYEDAYDEEETEDPVVPQAADNPLAEAKEMYSKVYKAGEKLSPKKIIRLIAVYEESEQKSSEIQPEEKNAASDSSKQGVSENQNIKDTVLDTSEQEATEGQNVEKSASLDTDTAEAEHEIEASDSKEEQKPEEHAPSDSSEPVPQKQSENSDSKQPTGETFQESTLPSGETSTPMPEEIGGNDPPNAKDTAPETDNRTPLIENKDSTVEE